LALALIDVGAERLGDAHTHEIAQGGFGGGEFRAEFDRIDNARTVFAMRAANALVGRRLGASFERTQRIGEPPERARPRAAASSIEAVRIARQGIVMDLLRRSRPTIKRRVGDAWRAITPWMVDQRRLPQYSGCVAGRRGSA